MLFCAFRSNWVGAVSSFLLLRERGSLALTLYLTIIQLFATVLASGSVGPIPLLKTVVLRGGGT